MKATLKRDYCRTTCVGRF
ncbi:hypothetical protein QN277_000924 [Acacia crassicarpa]|uniref:Uncharacterized protein n=1 Tax=Acacia crassicarpa TaxID=499986 RepID=A0AAE1TG63_9FABA|nr:hypothetical protein QN277_000924 [Acacia crassicarpa]